MCNLRKIYCGVHGACYKEEDIECDDKKVVGSCMTTRTGVHAGKKKVTITCGGCAPKATSVVHRQPVLPQPPLPQPIRVVEPVGHEPVRTRVRDRLVVVADPPEPTGRDRDDLAQLKTDVDNASELLPDDSASQVGKRIKKWQRDNETITRRTPIEHEKVHKNVSHREYVDYIEYAPSTRTSTRSDRLPRPIGGHVDHGRGGYNKQFRSSGRSTRKLPREHYKKLNPFARWLVKSIGGVV